MRSRDTYISYIMGHYLIPTIQMNRANRLFGVLLPMNSALNFHVTDTRNLPRILESIKIEQRETLVTLKQSLNPLSSYTIGVGQDILQNSKNWFIE